MIVRRLSWRDLAPDVAEQLHRFSIYTSPGFVALFESMKGRGGYFVVADDNVTVAAVPMVEFGRYPLVRMQAMPDGLYAPIWIAPALVDRTDELKRSLFDGIAEREYFKALVVDYDNALSGTGWQTIDRETVTVDLSGVSDEATWEPPDKTLRAEIAKSIRDGVGVVPFEASRQMSAFLRLMWQTEQRHERVPKYTEKFWERFAELSTTEARIRWLCVNAGDEMASAHIFFVDRGTALNWQIYYDKRFSALKANQAITSWAANQFRKEGIRILNLGATPAEAQGVETYKQKWGGTPYRYKTLHRRSWLGRLL
jgi:hypothetical protein